MVMMVVIHARVNRANVNTMTPTHKGDGDGDDDGFRRFPLSGEPSHGQQPRRQIRTHAMTSARRQHPHTIPFFNIGMRSMTSEGRKAVAS